MKIVKQVLSVASIISIIIIIGCSQPSVKSEDSVGDFKAGRIVGIQANMEKVEDYIVTYQWGSETRTYKLKDLPPSQRQQALMMRAHSSEKDRQYLRLLEEEEEFEKCKKLAERELAPFLFEDAEKALKNYIASYPKGYYTKAAEEYLSMVQKKEDDFNWQITISCLPDESSMKSIQKLADYIDNNPKGSHVDEAKNMITKIMIEIIKNNKEDKNRDLSYIYDRRSNKFMTFHEFILIYKKEKNITEHQSIEDEAIEILEEYLK